MYVCETGGNIEILNNMQYKYRRTETGKEARKDLIEGIDRVANIVKATLGPNGRNVMIEVKV